MAKGGREPFDIVVHSVDSQAMRQLSGNAYKAYSYLRKNADGYKFALSQKATSDYTGLNEKAYLKAINELIDKRFLIQRGDGNRYDFFLIGSDTTISVDQRTG